MTVRTFRRRAAFAAAPLLFVLLAGCSNTTGNSAETSAAPSPAGAPAAPSGTMAPRSPICSDVDALQSSVSNLQAVPLQVGALPQLQTIADQMKQQLNMLVADSKGQYEQQITPVRGAAEKLQNAIAAARQGPDATTLSAVRSATSELATALKNLRSSIGNRC